MIGFITILTLKQEWIPHGKRGNKIDYANVLGVISGANYLLEWFNENHPYSDINIVFLIPSFLNFSDLEFYLNNSSFKFNVGHNQVSANSVLLNVGSSLKL